MKAVEVCLGFLHLVMWVFMFPFVYPKLVNRAISAVNALSEYDMKAWDEYPYKASDEYPSIMMLPSVN